MRLKSVIFRDYVTTPGTEHDTMISFDAPWVIDLTGNVVTVRQGDLVAVFPWSSVKQGVPEERKSKG
jgi:hypothetical protein